MTPSDLVEVHVVDLPADAPDAEVLAAVQALAPETSTRRASGEPYVAWRELPDLDDVAAELAATRKAHERATEQAKAAVNWEGGASVSERELARKFGVDRLTIRRWRGK